MDWRDPDDYTYTEPLRSQEWAWEFLRRSARYLKAWSRYREVCRTQPLLGPLASNLVTEPFHLLEPVNPHTAAPDTGQIWCDVHDAAIDDTVGRDYPRPSYGEELDPEWTSFPFDLSLPINPQLETARQELLEKQKLKMGEVIPTPRFRRDQFSLYLRLLDAEAAGVNKREMARVLFPDREDDRRSTQQTLQTARNMTKYGWRKLRAEG